MTDNTTELNNLIRQITINTANDNINGGGPIKDALTKSGGEKFLLNFYNHTENDDNFKTAIELFQSNLIQNKCLELMACANDIRYETSINLMRKVMQLPNENLLDTFANKLCAFKYLDISLNHLMEMFLIEPHQPDFIVSVFIRETYVTSMEAMLQREIVTDLVSFATHLFDDNVSVDLLLKCCDNFRGFYDLIQTAIKKYSKLMGPVETDDGDLLWYFKIEYIKFNDFAKFICNLTSSPELSFFNDLLMFLKNTFPTKLLNHIFEKCQ